MKRKELIVLLVVIAGLAAYLVLRNTDRSHYRLPTLPEVVKNDLTRMEIITPEETISLDRDQDQWRIGDKGHAADPGKVQSMLSSLSDLTLTALVSEAQAYGRYDLTEDKKITVRLWAGNRQVREVNIGKPADMNRLTFVQIGDDPNVYHARENLRRTFDLDTAALRDKTVLDFSADAVRQLTLTAGEKTCVLTLNRPPADTADARPPEEGTPPAAVAGAWRRETGEAVDQELVKGLLSRLSTLTCEAYLTEAARDSMGAPVRTISVAGTATHHLQLYEKADNGFPATSSQNAHPFTLRSATGDRIVKDMDTLLAPEAGKNS